MVLCCLFLLAYRMAKKFNPGCFTTHHSRIYAEYVWCVDTCKWIDIFLARHKDDNPKEYICIYPVYYHHALAQWVHNLYLTPCFKSPGIKICYQLWHIRIFCIFICLMQWFCHSIWLCSVCRLLPYAVRIASSDINTVLSVILYPTYFYFFYRKFFRLLTKFCF